MLAMHKTIARAYAAENILSYAIAPGFTDTAMAGDYLDSRGGEGLLADIPLGRVAEPEEIADLVLHQLTMPKTAEVTDILVRPTAQRT